MLLANLIRNLLLELINNHIMLEPSDRLEFKSSVLPSTSELFYFQLLRLVSFESDKAFV